MADLELERSADDRRLYTLAGVGTLRFEGLTSRRATARAGESAWQLARVGFWGRRVEARDAAGAVVGSFEPRSVRRGGSVRWRERELTLRPASQWRERYALADGDDELAVLDGKGWGRRPVTIRTDDASAIEPGLLLFAAFVVRGLADDASAAAGAAASTAATGA
jgi:hypothetical protein